MKHERADKTGHSPNVATGGRDVDSVIPLSERAAQDTEDLELFFSVSLDLLSNAGLDGYFKRLNPAWTTQLG